MPAKRSRQNEQHAPRLDIEEVLQSFRDIDRKIEAFVGERSPRGLDGREPGTSRKIEAFVGERSPRGLDGREPGTSVSRSRRPKT